MSKNHLAIAAIAVIGISVAAPAFASEMVYHPVNPTFGGNPLNGSFLMSTAQGQGEGPKSGNQGPDLSGLDAALANGLGSTTIVSPNGTNGSGSNSGSGSASNGTVQSNSVQTNSLRALRTAQPLTSTSTANGLLGNSVP